MIKTFRGLLTNGQQERIRLETLDGKKGYKITKFEIIPETPGTIAQETICKIFAIKQTLIDGVINFSEQTLLGAAYYQDSTSAGDNQATTIVFDRVVFNQDIFITNKDVSGNTESINYYLELEQIRLDDVEATAVILKNFRNTNTTA